MSLVLESGTYNGRSTEIFRKYLPESCELQSIDVAVREEAKARLAGYRNVSLIEGNSVDELPRIIAARPLERVGVFIDGPKDELSIELATTVLGFRQVCFVGIHDTHRTSNNGTTPNPARCLLGAAPFPRFSSDEEWFVEAFSSFDEGESQPDYEQNLQWVAGGFKDPATGEMVRRIGSYGPTISFLFQPSALADLGESQSRPW